MSASGGAGRCCSCTASAATGAPSARSWGPWPPRELIAVDLPGFGRTPPLAGEVSVPALTDALTDFLAAQDLIGIDVVGSSLGARLALELAQRGVVGATVALDPGGFWQGWERSAFHASVAASIRLVRLLQPAMPAITGSAAGRTLLFAQFSARPWALPGGWLLEEMRSYAAARSFDPLLRSIAAGPPPRGAPAGGLRGPLVIGWGRRDRVTLPVQAPRALAAFPDARLHWFEHCGHFPHWDVPEEAVRVILDGTG